MGNCCGKSALGGGGEDNFAGPGRVLGSSVPAPNQQSASASAPRATIPAGASSTASKTTGSGAGSSGTALGGDGTGAEGSDPRSAAARAAEARFKQANTAKGKLERDLLDQKKQTRSETLQSAAWENKAQRDADEGAATRNWN